jgi:hypothetical protein
MCGRLPTRGIGRIEQEIAELNAPWPGQPPDTPGEACPGDLCRPGS